MAQVITAAEDMRPPTVAEYSRQLANGIGASFDLRHWCAKDCECLDPHARLRLLFEPVSARMVHCDYLLTHEVTRLDAQ